MNKSADDPMVRINRNLSALPQQIHESTLFDRDIDPDALAHARKFMHRFFTLLVSNGETWYDPHLTSEGNGDVEFEWSYGPSRNLLISVTASSVNCLWAWGPHIYTHMAESTDPDDDALIELWRWLCHDAPETQEVGA